MITSHKNYISQKGSHLSDVFASASASLAFGISIIVGWGAFPEIQHFGGPPCSLILQLNTTDVSTE
jgi:hypothetical protein